MTRSAKSRAETSAGGVVVRHGAEPLVLLIRDSYGKWGFPKGHVEEGEAPATAAAREVAEETGLADLTVVGGLDTISWEFQWRGRRVYKTCHFFLMESRSETTSPQRAEGITECRWESFDRAAELLAYANAREVLRRAREHLALRHRV
ncbi:MAG TPA: NUDIX hydrolase [Gemmatimonadaceae bacterium]|nr:NUDIX hydrolase [Gemmatimonadaceae bacterium]